MTPYVRNPRLADRQAAPRAIPVQAATTPATTPARATLPAGILTAADLVLFGQRVAVRTGRFLACFRGVDPRRGPQFIQALHRFVLRASANDRRPDVERLLKTLQTALQSPPQTRFPIGAKRMMFATLARVIRMSEADSAVVLGALESAVLAWGKSQDQAAGTIADATRPQPAAAIASGGWQWN